MVFCLRLCVLCKLRNALHVILITTVYACAEQMVNMFPNGLLCAGLVLAAGQHPDLASHMVVERPKVIYNALTQQFVMWMHIDDAR